ncbi:SixA phosphatase family protein [Modestobacter versicolor]|uniref:Phosphohistidine phosphatase n=1 Tax=Modestobacter versicolor TaxID=429133 RepID=A0A323VP17_9ACTN|nr:histidine phosphatase family protein [Modestobacter versicolor]MBB3675404.1 phosphohistidine phosphatase [Modestobacter versicolor]PZA21248.1 phosphohistidine phosphatase [Modestobacter versicolor]
MPPRRLVLVRHAQAADAAVDADRPLTGHGARRAAAIGTWLEQQGLTPDRVVVSPAVRAVQTWERAGGAAPVVEPRVYDNTVEALLEVIAEVPDEVHQLVVVGHNPSMSELAAVLDDGDGDDAARRGTAGGFPTGAVAVFDVGTPFAQLAPGTARLALFAVPGSG